VFQKMVFAYSKSGRIAVASPSRNPGKTRAKAPAFRGSMNAEFDYDLTPDQWEVLKALRVPAPERRGTNRSVLEALIALGLAAMKDDVPVITPRGRKVLVRGSSRLLDLAA
jgi:hypothetical protein